MINQKPIEPLPSPELIQQWYTEACNQGRPYFDYIATRSAQWGFNQHAALNEAELQKARDEELEGCVDWLKGEAMTKMWNTVAELASELHASRRPKPKSLAEQKQAIHDEIHQLLAQISANNAGALGVAEPIRRALERLRELEGNQ